MKINLYRFLILFCMVLLCSKKAYSGSVELTQRIDKSAMAAGAFMKVKDPFLRTTYPDVTYSSKVSLVYGREGRTDLVNMAAWGLKVQYTITYYDDHYVQTGVFPGNILTISNAAISGCSSAVNLSSPVYQSMQVFNAAGHNFGNVKVTIDVVTPVSTNCNISMSDIPADVRLELTLVNQSNFNLNSTQLFGFNSTTKFAYWSYLQGADSYQLEYVFIDKSESPTPFTPASQAFDHKEPVRVNTTNQHYTFSLTYPTGYVYLRVRGVGKFVGSGSVSARYSAWVYLASPYQVDVTGAGVEPVFEPLKNWQYVTSYSEDGNYKKVMTFYDGSLHSRQVSTNLSSENIVLVGETKYDYEGRPSLTVLPAPVNGSNLGYRNSLNAFTTPTKNAYDDSVSTGAEAMLTATGASRFYSSLNDVETINRSYIPSANGYPFSQVEYTRDGTGRMARQSNAGDVFKLLNPPANPTDPPKYTSFFYANANETELHRLFGTNVGVARHYQKNAVVDPNGQVSISYLDQEGRVVATALAGDSPLNVNPLTYATSNNNVTVSLDENSVVDRTNFSSRSVSTILNTVAPTTYNFNYSMTGVINNATGFFNLCKECTYDLKITVVGPDGKQLAGSPIIKEDIKPAVLPPNCSNTTYPDNIQQTQFVFTQLGNYTVTKELTLRTGAIETILSTLPGQTGLYPNLSNYITAHVALIDKSKCDITCNDHCLSNVLKLHPTWDPTNASWDHSDHTTAINTEVNNCITISCQGVIDGVINQVSTDECASLLQQMKDQFQPGGYYNTLPNWLETKCTNVIFHDAQGAVMATQPSIATLRDDALFQDQWANDLLTFHPEYLHYGVCTSNVQSGIYDKKMGMVKDMEEALAKGYLDDPTSNDPYFIVHSASKPLVQGAMTNYFNEQASQINADKDNFPNEILSLRDFVETYVPFSQSSSYVPTSVEKWKYFRSIYQGLKSTQQRLDEIAVCGNYLTISEALVTDPQLPTTESDMNQLNDGKIMQSCPGMCNENVQKWMTKLTDLCSPLSLADNSTILAKLTSYCNSTCGYMNPNGLLFTEDITVNSDLMAAQTILATYGCSLNSISTNNPYHLTCQSVTQRTLTPCAYQVVTEMKNLILATNRDSYTYNNTCPIKTDWKPGEIFKKSISGVDYYNAFYPLNNDCGSTLCQTNPYVMLTDNRATSLQNYDIAFLWGKNDAAYPASTCPPASQYQSPLCSLAYSPGFVTKFFRIVSGAKSYIEKVKIIDIGNPFIDFTYSLNGGTWNNTGVDGVAIPMVIDNGGGTTLSVTAYLEFSQGINWKTSYTPGSPGSVCVAQEMNTCSVKPDVSELELDGRISCGNGAALNITGAITVEAWIKDIQQGSDIVKKTSSGNSYILESDGDLSTVIFTIYSGSTYHAVSGGSISQNSGLWNHVAGTYDPSTGMQRIFVDGIEVGNANIGNIPIDISSGPFEIGGGFEGNIDEVRVWNVARTQAQIQASMYCPLLPSVSGLAGYWKLDETSGVSAFDASGNNNTGTISGPSYAWHPATSPLTQCNLTCPEIAAITTVMVPTQNGGTGPEILPNAQMIPASGNWFYHNGTIISTSQNMGMPAGSADLGVITGHALKTGNILTVGKRYKLTYSTSAIASGKSLKILNGTTWIDQKSTSNTTNNIVIFRATSPYIEFIVNDINSSAVVQFGALSVKEIIPPFNCLNVYENGTPLLTTCVNFTNATATAAALVTALNNASTNYIFASAGGTITVTGKAGKGSSVNDNSISVRAITNTPFLDDVISTGLMKGGRNFGDCCKNGFTFEADYSQGKTQCLANLTAIATYEATVEWQAAVDLFTSNFLEAHFNKCFDPLFLSEHFSYTYNSKEYHYTLYYYDQAGNLVMTVPPEGVNPLLYTSFPGGKYNNDQVMHNLNLATTYKYDGLNNLVYQKSPDGGRTYFWYNSKGQLKLSQNAKQTAKSNIAGVNPNKYLYSYTRYDKQGRIAEVGQMEDLPNDTVYLNSPANAKVVYAMLDDLNFPQIASFLLTNMTQTTYDGIATQDNLRGRVATVAMKETEGSNESNTLYTYDAHGNVKSLTQQITGLADKKVDYEYDLISSKVRKVYYQKGQTDQFIHAYCYDSDNRIRSAATSADGYLWEEDAKYFYYKNGPLARTELGKDKVQGQDYYYTLQGWIKGVNIPDLRQDMNLAGRYKVNNDPGKDGFVGTGNLNQFVGQDEFAYSLGYYDGDYTSIATTNLNAGGNNNWIAAKLGSGMLQHGLYNGNISFMVTQVHALGYHPNLGGIAAEKFGLSANAYQYDQLNRITDSRQYKDYTTGTWSRTNTSINSSAYDAHYDYDKNGNIMHAQVNGPSNSPVMDQLTYHYTGDNPGDNGGVRLNNKLNYVADLGPSGTGTPATDIENQTSVTNYGYDQIGNLIRDDAEKILLINWNPYGKIKEITRVSIPGNATPENNKSDLVFIYDASGNRVVKIEKPRTNGNLLLQAQWVYTYYVRDASGNVIAINNVSPGSSSIEYNIYGSSRLGNFRVTNTTGANVQPYQRALGRKNYELSNHLGNVLAVVSDLKLGVDTIPSDGMNRADYYQATALAGHNYYPFGMQQEGRSYDVPVAYRYGFNGKEMDNEVKGTGNQYDYGFRIYDSRLGRFLSVDPLTKEYPMLTPYQFASNSPIAGLDRDGLEFEWAQKAWNATSSGYNTAVKVVDEKFTEYVAKPVVNALEAGDKYYYKNVYGAATEAGVGSDAEVNLGALKGKVKGEYTETKSNQTKLAASVKGSGKVDVGTGGPAENKPLGAGGSSYITVKFDKKSGEEKETGGSITTSTDVSFENKSKGKLNLGGNGLFFEYNHTTGELKFGVTYGAKLELPISYSNETELKGGEVKIEHVSNGTVK